MAPKKKKKRSTHGHTTVDQEVGGKGDCSSKPDESYVLHSGGLGSLPVLESPPSSSEDEVQLPRRRRAKFAHATSDGDNDDLNGDGDGSQPSDSDSGSASGDEGEEMEVAVGDSDDERDNASSSSASSTSSGMKHQLANVDKEFIRKESMKDARKLPDETKMKIVELGLDKMDKKALAKEMEGLITDFTIKLAEYKKELMEDRKVELESFLTIAVEGQDESLVADAIKKLRNGLESYEVRMRMFTRETSDVLAFCSRKVRKHEFEVDAFNDKLKDVDQCARLVWRELNSELGNVEMFCGANVAALSEEDDSAINGDSDFSYDHSEGLSHYEKGEHAPRDLSYRKRHGGRSRSKRRKPNYEDDEDKDSEGHEKDSVNGRRPDHQRMAAKSHRGYSHRNGTSQGGRKRKGKGHQRGSSSGGASHGTRDVDPFSDDDLDGFVDLQDKSGTSQGGWKRKRTEHARGSSSGGGGSEDRDAFFEDDFDEIVDMQDERYRASAGNESTSRSSHARDDIARNGTSRSVGIDQFFNSRWQRDEDEFEWSCLPVRDALNSTMSFSGVGLAAKADKMPLDLCGPNDNLLAQDGSGEIILVLLLDNVDGSMTQLTLISQNLREHNYDSSMLVSITTCLIDHFFQLESQLFDCDSPRGKYFVLYWHALDWFGQLASYKEGLATSLLPRLSVFIMQRLLGHHFAGQWKSALPRWNQPTQTVSDATLCPISRVWLQLLRVRPEDFWDLLNQAMRAYPSQNHLSKNWFEAITNSWKSSSMLSIKEAGRGLLEKLPSDYELTEAVWQLLSKLIRLEMMAITMNRDRTSANNNPSGRSDHVNEGDGTANGHGRKDESHAVPDRGPRGWGIVKTLLKSSPFYQEMYPRGGVSQGWWTTEEKNVLEANKYTLTLLHRLHMLAQSWPPDTMVSVALALSQAFHATL